MRRERRKQQKRSLPSRPPRGLQLRMRMMMMRRIRNKRSVCIIKKQNKENKKFTVYFPSQYFKLKDLASVSYLMENKNY
jgi:hypothetical protein